MRERWANVAGARDLVAAAAAVARGVGKRTGEAGSRAAWGFGKQGLGRPPEEAAAVEADPEEGADSGGGQTGKRAGAVVVVAAVVLVEGSRRGFADVGEGWRIAERATG